MTPPRVPPVAARTTVRPHRTEDVVDAVLAWSTKRRGRVVKRGDGHLVVRFGSRLAYRVLGARRVDPLPFRLVVATADPDGGSAVTVRLESDEGPAVAANNDAARCAYEEQHTRLLAQLIPALTRGARGIGVSRDPGVGGQAGALVGVASIDDPESLLSRLVGAELAQVVFVMDTLQLRFQDGPTNDFPTLNCDVMPAVEGPDGTVRPDDAGHTDALVALIQQRVTAATVRTGHGLRIELGDAAVVMHPRVEDLVGPEIALLQGFDDREWMCWRPGQDGFEDVV